MSDSMMLLLVWLELAWLVVWMNDVSPRIMRGMIARLMATETSIAAGWMFPCLESAYR